MVYRGLKGGYAPLPGASLLGVQRNNDFYRLLSTEQVKSSFTGETRDILLGFASNSAETRFGSGMFYGAVAGIGGSSYYIYSVNKDWKKKMKKEKLRSEDCKKRGVTFYREYFKSPLQYSDIMMINFVGAMAGGLTVGVTAAVPVAGVLTSLCVASAVFLNQDYTKVLE